MKYIFNKNLFENWKGKIQVKQNIMSIHKFCNKMATIEMAYLNYINALNDNKETDKKRLIDMLWEFNRFSEFFPEGLHSYLIVKDYSFDK
jgi:hypothetical protein